MNEEILKFAFTYYVRQNHPKEWKSYLLPQQENPPYSPEFLLWWETKKSEITDFYLKQAESHIQICYPGHPHYPKNFLDKLETPPLLLFYLGNPIWLHQTGIAVVGARKMTPQSKQWINSELYAYLIETKKIVVSGGARGVDQEAHFQSLRLSLPTIVILPSGIHKMYPATLSEWKDDVLKKGGVFLSEYFPAESMKTFHFIQRNRLIATLAKSVLIVQGEKRSGTLLTAKLSLDLGQNIGVIPGHPMDPAYSGNNELLQWGVSPIVDQQDLRLFCD